MEQNDFLQTLMVMPMKPEFVGFTMDSEKLHEQLVAIVSESIGQDASDICSWSCDNEDNEFWFNLDTEALYDMVGEEEYNKIWEALPFNPDSPWEATQLLIEKMYDLKNSWAIANVRSWDTSQVEIQIGIPRKL